MKKRKGIGRSLLGFVAFLFLSGCFVTGVVVREQWLNGNRRELYLSDLENALSRSPSNTALLATTAARLAECGNYSRSAELLKTTIELGETSPAVWRLRAACEAALGRQENAQSLLMQGEKQSPSAAKELQYAEGRIAQINPANKVDTTLIVSNSAKTLLENFAPPNLLSGVIEWWGNQHPQRSGFETRQRTVDDHPQDPLAHALWSDALLKNRRVDEAEAQARRAVELDVKSADAHLILGNVLLQEGEAGLAAVHYKTALQQKPDWLPALIGLGNAAIQRERIPLAVDCFQKAMRRDENDPDVWIGLGRAYSHQDSAADKSLAAFATASRLAPERTDFYADYAESMRKNGRFEDAEKLLRQRIDTALDDMPSRLYLADLLLSHERTPEREGESKDLLMAALNADQKSLPVRLRLAALLLEQNKPAEAVPILEVGHGIYPNNLEIMTLLERSYRLSNENDEARTARAIAIHLRAYNAKLKAALEKVAENPLNLSVHVELADLYRSGDEDDKADKENAYIRLLAKNPLEAKRESDAKMRALESAFSGDHPTAH